MQRARGRSTSPPSSKKTRRAPPFLSAPSITDLTEVVGTRPQLLAALQVQRWWRRRSPTLTTLIEFLLKTNTARDAARVRIHKSNDGTFLGLSCRSDSPRHPILLKVDAKLPAATCLQPFDEILSVAGEPCQSAEHAIQLIRNAPAGSLELIKLLPPRALVHSARVLQKVYRARVDLHARSRTNANGLVRRMIAKPERSCRLGVSLSPEWRVHSMLAKVDPSGIAHTVLHEGDQLRFVNGVACTEPAQTAKLLRESVGSIELLLLPQPRVDMDAMRSEELKWIDRAIAASTGSLDGDDGVDAPGDECAVCFQLLCEPVRWPGASGARCHHYFCKPCSRQLAGHGGDHTPSCPLCRAPAHGEFTPRKIVVDEAAASLIQRRHPEEYAEALMLHRELSVEWANRSQLPSAPAPEAANEPAARRTVERLPPTPSPMLLPVCIDFAVVNDRLQSWQRGRRPGESASFRAVFSFTQTDHLHAIAHALARAQTAHKVLILPTASNGAGAEGLVASVMTASIRSLIDVGHPLSTLDNLLRERRLRGEVSLELFVSHQSFVLVSPPTQDETQLGVWTAQAIPSQR